MFDQVNGMVIWGFKDSCAAGWLIVARTIVWGRLTWYDGETASALQSIRLLRPVFNLSHLKVSG